MAGSGHSEGITMSGGGLYSLATIGAKHVIDAATPMVLDAIDKLPQDSMRSGFTFSDMGTADAGTSMSMITAVVDAVAARAPGAPVTVIYSDQPRNDFNALIANVYGLGSYESYLERHADIFPMVSGTSFYRQIVPSNTLDIGFSATAMHWLSDKVCNLSNHVQAVGAQGDELAAFQGRAGGKLLRVDPASGKVTYEMELASPPVFDGLIAAQGHLYMCTRKGDVIRFR